MFINEYDGMIFAVDYEHLLGFVFLKLSVVFGQHDVVRRAVTDNGRKILAFEFGLHIMCTQL